MKKAFKKYFITILSFLLILSNFSYAATVMACGMMGDGKVKSCSCRNDDNTQSGVKLSKIKNSCCEVQTIELSNSSNLLKVNNELPQLNFKAVGLINLNTLIDNSSFAVYNSFLTLSSNRKLPSDIPILFSSLLI